MSTSQPTDNSATARRRTLLLIHGRGVKPSRDALTSLWQRALAQGLKRDHKTNLDAVQVEFIHYGDFTADIDPDQQNFDPLLDLADRENALQRLAGLDSAKVFKRSKYESVPGQSPLREFLTDVGTPIVRLLGLADKRIARYLPELHHYWADDSVADNLRRAIREPLADALERGDHIMVISHCIGSVLAYDAFWELTEQSLDSSHRIHTWVTLGAPLADDDVKVRLAGFKKGFPNILINWFNLAAEDDPYCHDETVANDFAGMLESRNISRIQDYRIYNLTERFGRSDPHGSLGYLVHPRMSRLLHDWLTIPIDT